MEYYFSMPKITDLTMEQQAALYEESPIALSGGAGTGKSLVSLYRHINNIDVLNKTSMLCTYTKTLTYYLMKAANSLSENAGEYVYGSLSFLYKEKNGPKFFDEIIIDEAQDLNRYYLEGFKKHAKDISYGADVNQILYKFQYEKELDDKEIKEERRQTFQNLFPYNEEYRLEENFRNTKEIIEFTRSLMPDFNIKSDIEKRGRKPVVVVTNNEIQKITEIIEVVGGEEENIAILVPFKANVDFYYEYLKDIFDCSYYHNEKEDINMVKNIHITTFKSAKGLEFDSVIIPKFQDYEYIIENYKIISKNDYYVAFTRARTNLFLISDRENLNIDSNTYRLEK
jgi:DNA helicase IV